MLLPYARVTNLKINNYKKPQGVVLCLGLGKERLGVFNFLFPLPCLTPELLGRLNR